MAWARERSSEERAKSGRGKRSFSRREREEVRRAGLAKEIALSRVSAASLRCFSSEIGVSRRRVAMRRRRSSGCERTEEVNAAVWRRI